MKIDQTILGMNMETEFDVMFKQILLSLNGVINIDYIKLGKRVGNKFQDICIHIPYREIKETRPICCIEVKKISTSGLEECYQGNFTQKLEFSVRQALGYSQANHYIRHNIKVQPFCLLTDGKYLAILDPSLSWIDNVENLIKFKKDYIKVVDANTYKEIFSVFKDKKVEDLINEKSEKRLLLPSVKSAFRDAETCDSKLAKNLLGTHQIFKKLGLDEEVAIDYTMQCFLLAILRNCGFIKVEEIEDSLKLEKNNDWLIKLLDQWFGNNFYQVKPAHIDAFKKAYSTTRTYDVRVDAMPQESLGYAYESFIKDAKKVKTTEFYTPDKLIEDVLDRLIPTSKDIVFDPTCGCGSFLIEAVRRVFSNNAVSKNEIESLGSYLTNNVFGNDRDVYAICIAKASLLSFFVERLGVDPTMVDVKLPSIRQNFTRKDYFDFKWTKKQLPSLVIGNAPWGDVSRNSENFSSLVKSDEIWKSIMKTRNLGDDRHEISGSIVLKCIDDFSSNPKFRMGMLVKQQLLVEGKDKFLDDERAKKCFFYDYGPLFLFAHTNSLTGVAFYERGAKSSIVSKFDRNNINWGDQVSFSEIGCRVYQGVQTGKNDIWKDLASKNELKDLIVNCIDRTNHKIPIQKPPFEKLVYLEPQSRILNKKNKDKKDLEYIEDYKKRYRILESNLTSAQKTELLKMTTGARKKSKKEGQKVKESKSDLEFKFSWRRPINDDFLSKKWKLMFPNQFTGVDGSSRLPVYLTKEKVIVKTSYTEFVFDQDVDDKVFNVLGWMSSKVFVHFVEHLASSLKIKRLSGGYELLPEYAEKISIPKSIYNSKELSNLVKSIHSARVVSDEDLEAIDKKIVEILKIDSLNKLLTKMADKKKKLQQKNTKKTA